jgi:hypothetical protein
MKKFLLLASIILSSGLIAARADIIPTFTGTTGSQDQQSTIWSYTINVTAEQNATSGDFFTIYDFGNFVPDSSSAPAGWTFSASLVGVTPAQTHPTDDPSLYNLTWTYSGPTISGATPAGQNIGPFSIAVSGFDPEFQSPTRMGQFAAQGTRATGPDAGTKVNNVGAIPVPAAIPEPSTLALIFGTGGLGMIGRAIARRRR